MYINITKNINVYGYTSFLLYSRKTYYLSFPILDISVLTRSLQSTPYQNLGGGSPARYTRTNTGRTEYIVSSLGLQFSQQFSPAVTDAELKLLEE